MLPTPDLNPRPSGGSLWPFCTSLKDPPAPVDIGLEGPLVDPRPDRVSLLSIRGLGICYIAGVWEKIKFTTLFKKSH